MVGPPQAAWQEAPICLPGLSSGLWVGRWSREDLRCSQRTPASGNPRGQVTPSLQPKRKAKIAASWERGHLLSRGRPEQQRLVPNPGLVRLLPTVHPRGGGARGCEGTRQTLWRLCQEGPGPVTGTPPSRPRQNRITARVRPSSSRRPAIACGLGLPRTSLGTGTQSV